MSTAYQTEPHQPGLDGLRGIAILAVVTCHFAALLPPGMGPPILRVELNYGWAGVDLFFALSGFLITRILLRTKGREGYLLTFWMRRALRIFPLYYLTLIVTLGAAELIPALRALLPPDQDRLLYFLFLSNWASLWPGSMSNILGHLWSVAVEEQFYLIWPLCVLALSRRQLGLLAAVTALVMLLVRVGYITAFGAADYIGRLTITRTDGLALGALAAVLLSLGEVSPRCVRYVTIGSLAALDAFWAGTVAYGANPVAFYQTFGYSLLAVGFSAGVFAVAATRSRTPFIRVLEARWLTNVGKYSFGIYLFHVPILETFKQLAVPRIAPLWNANVVLVIACTSCLWLVTYYLAKISFETFETPILRLKRYVQPGRKLQPAFGIGTESGVPE